jgi:phosphatidylglycerophosphatase A
VGHLAVANTFADLEQAVSHSLPDRVVMAFATGFGFGRLPKAPGTFGSLWGLVLVRGLEHVPTPWRWLIAAGIVGVGVPICARAAALLNAKDPRSVVFDEIAAFPIVFCGVTLNWTTGLLGFVLFRLFDIVKPYPVSRLEGFSGGWGIMADDLAAGAYAGACLWSLSQFVL